MRKTTNAVQPDPESEFSEAPEIHQARAHIEALEIPPAALLRSFHENEILAHRAHASYLKTQLANVVAELKTLRAEAASEPQPTFSELLQRWKDGDND